MRTRWKKKKTYSDYLVIVLEDFALDLGRINPCHKVLHAASDQEGRVGDDLRAHADMALLDKRDSLLDRLGHLETDHYNWQSSSRARADCKNRLA